MVVGRGRHNGGVNQTDVAVAELDTSVGRLRVAVTAAGLAEVGWVDTAREAPAPPSADPSRTEPILEQLRAYFRGEREQFDIALDWRSMSETRRTVLQALFTSVGFGESITYGGLADRSGTGVPARAIGGIMGSNPIPIVVPCHRVLSHDGLGGYSGGTGADALEVKRWLLTMEGVLPPTLDFSPDGIAGGRSQQYVGDLPEQ
ncbi:MAG: methylated-DNA--[protein]-cysteine S-methyltransferase [Actinophytocola sp.]|nr:methylated-DNA--[protein]-cysteine S-methyltransferase [Actinophytocola sp.]